MTKRPSAVAAILALALIFAPCRLRADSFTFGTLPPSGDIQGLPGETIGWGYSITNESLTNWLVLTALSADSFINGNPNSIFDFPILAPDTTVSLAFNANNGFGLYELVWDSLAPAGFVNSGSFIASAEWWDGDPFDDGNFIDFAEDQSAPYSATVTTAAAPIPEPSTLLLLATGVGALCLKKRRIRSRRICTQKRYSSG